MSEPIPNLFVIGAMRAGTTALHEALGSHPDIAMSRFKEPAYFADPAQLALDSRIVADAGYVGDRERYLQLFADTDDRRYRGESSTHYTKSPRITGVAPRIAEMSPDARIIYLVRDPVERTLSHYRYALFRKTERRPCLDALRADPFYVQVSDYATQVEPYLQVFGRDQVKLVVLEELTAAPTERLGELFEWLDVRPASNIRYEQRNASTASTRAARGPDLLHRFGRSGLYRRIARTVIPQPVRAGVRAALHRDVESDETRSDAVLGHLLAVHTPQVRRLETLFGRSFGQWSTAEAT